MEKKSYVYILSIKNGDFLKIGKAKDVINRLNALNISEPIDYDRSWFIEMKNDDRAFALEWILHNIFKDYKIPYVYICDSGNTEWFCKTIYDKLITSVGAIKLVPLIKFYNKPRPRKPSISNEAAAAIRWINDNIDQCEPMDEELIERIRQAKTGGVSIEWLTKFNFIDHAYSHIYDRL